MSSGTIIFFEMILVLGLVLAFGFYELRSLRRYRRRDEEAARDTATTTPDGTRPPVG